MGILGKPYRIGYEARNFATGLIDVAARILRPDGSQSGPFTMIEASAPFGGRYFVDLISMPTDPEGEYFIAIQSPSEGIQTTERVSLYSDISIQTQISELNDIINNLNSISVNLSNAATAVSAASNTIVDTSLVIQTAATGIDYCASVLNVACTTIYESALSIDNAALNINTSANEINQAANIVIASVI